MCVWTFSAGCSMSDQIKVYLILFVEPFKLVKPAAHLILWTIYYNIPDFWLVVVLFLLCFHTWSFISLKSVCFLTLSVVLQKQDCAHRAAVCEYQCGLLQR